MNGLSTGLAILGAVFFLAALFGGLWVAFRSGSQDARIKRLQAEATDYVSRLNYIEPKLQAAEDQNRILRELQNPTAQLGRIEDTGSKMLAALDTQAGLLRDIERQLPHPKDADS